MIFAFSASTARLKRSTGAAGTRPTAPSNVSRNIGTRSTKRCAGGSDKPDNSIANGGEIRGLSRRAQVDFMMPAKNESG